MPSFRQASFAGGELAPELWGRTDLARHAMALKRCRNFIPARSGAAVTRPSMLYLGPVKGGALGEETSTPVRLVPYLYSSGATVTAYLLEFGDLYFRVWQGGVYTGVEKASPYAASNLSELQWAQEGNTLTLTRPAFAPREVKFTGTDWTITAVSFARPTINGTVVWNGGGYPAPDADHVAKEWSWVATQLERDVNGNILESAPTPVDLSQMFTAWNNGTSYTKGQFVSYSSGYFVAIVDSVPAGSTPPGYSVGVANPYWAPVDPAAPPLPIYPDKTITFHAFPSGAVMGGTLFGFRWYRGAKGGPLGWVGDSGSPWGTTPGLSFTDVGDDPDYSVGPPQGLNPFVVGAATETPAAVAHYEERRIFGGTESRPHTLFASGIAEPSNFDKPIVARKDTSVVFALASGRGEQIRSFVSKSDLLVLTNSSIWAVSGGDGPLAFDSIQAVPQSEIGSSWLPGITVGRSLLYVRDGGSGVRSLAYSWERQGYTDLDLSLIAQHLVRNRTITDWAYAAEPWSVAWMVRSDGVLLSLTLARDEQEQEEGVVAGGGGIRYAWAWHDTDGTVESVCVLREGGEDVVYLVVSRYALVFNGGDSQPRPVRYLERLASRILTEDSGGEPVVGDAFALDSAKTYSGSPATLITGFDHLTGRDDIYAIADGYVVGPLTVDDAGRITLQQASSEVHVGLAFEPELELLDVATQAAEVRTRKKALKEVTVEVVQSRGLAVGPDADHLTEWKQRTVADGYGPIPYATEHVRIAVAGGFNEHARAFLRQTQPLPLTVAAITREVVFGG